MENNCRFSLGTEFIAQPSNTETCSNSSTTITKPAGGRWRCPTALWEQSLLPESGRRRNEGTQNPAGEPHSYQTLHRAGFTQETVRTGGGTLQTIRIIQSVFPAESQLWSTSTVHPKLTTGRKKSSGQ